MYVLLVETPVGLLPLTRKGSGVITVIVSLPPKAWIHVKKASSVFISTMYIINERNTMKLYELPQRNGIKLYGLEPNGDKDGVVIFDHVDGMYSYCWIEGQEDAIVHLNASTELTEHKDGYKLRETR